MILAHVIVVAAIHPSSQPRAAAVHVSFYYLRFGPPPGKYRVEIVWYKKTGKQVVGSDPPNKEDETIQVIPEKYNKASELKVDLTSGSNTHDFPLKSSKKK